VFEQFCTGAVLAQDSDQAYRLAEARQVFGYVAGYAAIRAADARRVRGSRPEVSFEATDYIDSGGAKNKDGSTWIKGGESI
jgi:hypothetical protein